MALIFSSLRKFNELKELMAMRRLFLLCIALLFPCASLTNEVHAESFSLFFEEKTAEQTNNLSVLHHGKEF